MASRAVLSGNYGPSVWAAEINVATEGNRLSISGKVPFSESDLKLSDDLFLIYLQNRESSNKGARNKSAHLEFANARNDEDLIAFVRRFGPVAASEVNLGGYADNGAGDMASRETINAFQGLKELRREQGIYRMCLRLLSELTRGEKDASLTVMRECASFIVPSVSEWLRDWKKECVSRDHKKQGPPFWQFQTANYNALRHFQAGCASEPSGLAGYDPFSAGHEVLCGILNAFPTKIEFLLDRPIETVPYESLLYGVRPLLYLILRHEYLTQIGIDICANPVCARLFVIERLHQRFCDEDCSRRFRQRQYWANRGSRRRAQRRTKKSRLKRKRSK